MFINYNVNNFLSRYFLSVFATFIYNSYHNIAEFLPPGNKKGCTAGQPGLKFSIFAPVN